MATNLGTIGSAFVDIRANLATLDKDLRKVSSRISKGLVSSGRSIQQVGTKLTRGIALPLAALGGLAVRQFAQFDNAMTESLAIMGDVSVGMRQEMAGAAREMAKVTSFSAKEAAESFFFLASAGLDAVASIKALPVVARFAQAGAFSMARATDLLTDAQSALGKTIRDDAVANMREMIKVSDVLVKANTLANATVQQFSESLTNRAGAAMRQLNIDIEEGVAVLAAWADQGIKGTLAGEQFSIVTRDLQRAARKNQEEFKKFGVQVFDSAGGIRNLADIITDLEVLLGSMSIQQQGATLMLLGFQDRSVQAVRSLLGFSDVIRRYESSLRSAGGITEEVAEKQLTSFSKQMGLLLSRVNDVAISIGQILAPVILQFRDFLETSVIPVLEKGIAAFRGMGKGSASMASKLAVLAVAFGPVLIAVGLLGQVLGFIVSGIGVFGTAIFGIARTLTLFAGVIVKVAAVAATAFLRMFAPIALIPASIVLALGAILGTVVAFKGTIVGFFKGTVTAIKNAFVGGFRNKVVIPFQEAINKLVEFLPDSVVEFLDLKPLEVDKEIAPSFADDMKKVMAEAGQNAAREMENFKKSASASIDFVKDKFKDLANVVGRFIPELDFGLAVEAIEEPLEEIVITAKKRFSQIQPIINGVKIDMESLGETISSSMENNLADAATAFQSFGDAARNIIRQVLAELTRLILIQPLIKGLLAAVGFPGLEHGGSVRANKPVIVGEGGRPELFVPNVSGKIIPNDRLRIGNAEEGGAGGDIHQEFNFPLVFPTQLEAFVRNVAGPAGRDAATQVIRARRGKF
ncbi:hypothetical protein LCGC14_1667920 [marine sediment metagenome]|uniref:Phage tail tape measure protein domain-containing protein n=1 Tax=marine sediment metagenome TaxID=412755 RepID=A0A0F9HS45_9ZZZZ